jgi:hypothetical protein
MEFWSSGMGTGFAEFCEEQRRALQFKNLPDLAVGRAWWDNWMIYNAKRHGIPVIDATKMVLAVHQNHDYSHCKGGLKEAYFEGPEVRKNLSYVRNGKVLMTIRDAEWIIENGKIKFAFNRLGRHVIQSPLLFPLFRWPVKAIKAVLKPAIKIPWVKGWLDHLFGAEKR